MHMESALISTAVGGVMMLASTGVTGRTALALRKDDQKTQLPLIAVAGAAVFAAQMMNFTIPGLGASGHMVGGILLAALLGSRAGYLTLASILTLQCLLFADGGLMALGANVFNMAALSCLVAFPLIYKPIAKDGAAKWRVMLGAVAANMASLAMGSLAVVLQTTLSGNTALPFATFLAHMLPIHLAIGAVEGVLTGGVLIAIRALSHRSAAVSRRAVVALGLVSVALAGALYSFASSFPDGLEWSVGRTSGMSAVVSAPQGLSAVLSNVQAHTALLPDYALGGAASALPGLMGVLLSAMLALGIGLWINAGRRTQAI